MDSLHHLLWHNGKFLGIEWSLWKVIGFLGIVIFSSRVIVQWYVTEKLRRVSVPAAYWWLSLVGSVTLLGYAIYQNKDSVVILGYAFAWIPYIRNLVIHYRHEREQIDCAQCGHVSSPTANFCSKCGAKLTQATSLTGR